MFPIHWHRPQHLLLSGLHMRPVPITTPSFPAQHPLPERILKGLSEEPWKNNWGGASCCTVGTSFWRNFNGRFSALPRSLEFSPRVWVSHGEVCPWRALCYSLQPFHQGGNGNRNPEKNRGGAGEARTGMGGSAAQSPEPPGNARAGIFPTRGIWGARGQGERAASPLGRGALPQRCCVWPLQPVTNGPAQPVPPPAAGGFHPAPGMPIKL